MTAGNEEHEPLISTSAEHQRATYSTPISFDHSENDRRSSRDSNHTNGTAHEVSLFIPPINGNGGGRKNYGSMVTPAAKERVTYAWHDINVYTTETQNKHKRGILDFFRKKETSTQKMGQKKHILKNVSGVAYPGELLAIMGSSGAGKTTLLNALTFRSGGSVTASGSRTLSGVPATLKTLVSYAAYVQQDDLFIGTLTPKEHLIFQALVRMDRHIPYAYRMQRVNEVIAELALTKCQNTVIGVPGRLKGISGGEMKRLSFASEVLTDPPLMFCDEPTSGLDSFMAQNVIQVLKNLAQKGKTVVCTIHQPSSELYAMFDKLLLMAEGRVAFLGSPNEANRFFSELGVACPDNYNPADHFVQLLAVRPGDEVASRNGIETICDAFEKNEIGQKMLVEVENASLKHKTSRWIMEDFWNRNGDNKPQRYKATWIAQFRAVLWRSWLSVIKEPMLIKVRFLQTALVATLIGIIYFGQNLDQDGVMNINGSIFMFLTNMTFQNVFAVINVFCSELPIFLRENRSGVYRTDVYFLCKTLAEAPIFATIPIIFTGISYFMIGLNPEMPRFFIAAGVSILVANVATSFGYFISCASSSTAMAVSIGPPLVIPFMLFGGFFLNAGSIPPYFEWLSYLSWFRYGNEALLINQWDGIESIACTSTNATCPRNGDVVLATLSFTPSDMTMDLVSLVMLVVGFRLTAFLFLLSRTYRKER